MSGSALVQLPQESDKTPDNGLKPVADYIQTLAILSHYPPHFIDFRLILHYINKIDKIEVF